MLFVFCFQASLPAIPSFCCLSPGLACQLMNLVQTAFVNWLGLAGARAALALTSRRPGGRVPLTHLTHRRPDWHRRGDGSHYILTKYIQFGPAGHAGAVKCLNYR